MKRFIGCLMTLSFLFVMGGTAMSEELITNGDFEDGDFSGWTFIEGEVFINDVLNPYFGVPPISGEYDAIMIAYPENDHEGAFMIQGSASLPENIVSATFSWSDRIFNSHDDFVTGTGGFPQTGDRN